MTDIKHEIWKAVEGFHDHYEVSSRGRVRSLDRSVVAQSGHKRAGWRKVKGRVLSPGNKGGRPYVHLRLEGISSVIRIDALVLQAFVGDKPDGYVIEHIDGDQSNGDVSNLRYVVPTPKPQLRNRSDVTGQFIDKEAV